MPPPDPTDNALSYRLVNHRYGSIALRIGDTALAEAAEHETWQLIRRYYAECHCPLPKSSDVRPEILLPETLKRLARLEEQDDALDELKGTLEDIATGAEMRGLRLDEVGIMARQALELLKGRTG